ncbi:MAG: ACT domain-containing protein [Candidatus Hydrothermarchaeales archaeon]
MRLTGLTKEILENVDENPGLHMADLAKNLGLHPRSIDRHIRTLRELGLIRTKRGRAGGLLPTEDAKVLLRKGEVSLGYAIDIMIVSNDRPGLLADISSKIAQNGGNIVSTSLNKPTGYTVQMVIRVEGADPKVLESSIKEITDIKDIRIETI